VHELETDYLVVGAGASGMAFVDSLLSHSTAEVVLVDRRHRPGGHWLDAYPFVRLHQPSANYGVNSRPLGTNRIDNAGPNAAQRWLPSGAMDPDIWIENIPYNETRAYVQRILWHSVVFAWLRTGKAQDAHQWLGAVSP